jgi:hypothetical protein
MSKIISFIIILFFLSACQSAKDAFTLKKKSSTDEFLVEKKSPLVLPPDYNKLPLPDDQKNENKTETQDDEIKLIIGNSNENASSSSKKNNIPASLEKSILKKIK